MSKGGGGKGPIVLIVLDGWGHRDVTEGNAIALGKTPNWDRLVNRVPMTLIQASSEAVGLPCGQMGNSEVGHLNLGAGRVMAQDIVRISESIKTGEFFQNRTLSKLLGKVKKNDGTLHLIGLIGTGGVHAHHDHMVAAIEAAARNGLRRVVVHGFLDGRDTPPTSAAEYMRTVSDALAQHSTSTTQCVVGSVTGRYFAMDRDNRWDRTQLAYDAMIFGHGNAVSDPVQGIFDAYERGETDEFIMPLVINHEGSPATIQDGDGVFCFNFRADRMRQIVRALAWEGFDNFDTGLRPNISLATMTEYDQTFPFPVAFGTNSLADIVGEVISDAGRTQLRTAETEKYAHVTYFFNAGREVPFDGEERQLVPSQKVATYDLKPEMSAPGITEGLCRAIEGRQYDFILCNYANGDMVGHTGKMDATIIAVQTVDECLGRILKSAEKAKATVMITADHGNCEMMTDPETGGPHTAHTTNPVPFLLYGDDAAKSLRSGGALQDVGPTVLNLLNLNVPETMTGRDLREGINLK